MKVYYCTNLEILAQYMGLEDVEQEDLHPAFRAVEAAVAEIIPCAEIDGESLFREWKGRQWTQCGRLATWTVLSKRNMDRLMRVSDAFDSALNAIADEIKCFDEDCQAAALDDE